MKGLRHLLLPVLLLAVCRLAAEQRRRPDWQAWFDEAGTTGVLVLYDLERDLWQISDTARARERFIPASTFKIPNTLIALETGVLGDERAELPWDGVTREIADWNRPHQLRGALRVSCVPVFQELARRIGPSRMKSGLEALGYGNADLGGGVDRFWLDGALRISALEQVEFLKRFQQGTLPLAERSLRIAREALICEAGPDWILRAKTGWGARLDPQVGWWVGWVEGETRTVIFACNLDIREPSHLSLRQALTRRALVGVGALPTNKEIRP